MTPTERVDTAAIITRLAEMFPQAFSVYEGRRRPLAIGIRDQIAERVGDAITPDELSAALRAYTRNPGGYLRAMARGGARIDLEGNPAGMIIAEQAAAATKAVAAHWARVAARKAAARMACAEPEPRPAAPSPAPETPAGPKRLGLLIFGN